MKDKKLWRRGALIALGLVLVFWGWKMISDNRLMDRMNAGGEPKSESEYFRYYNLLEEAYKKDNYGSTTPEGTLELFVQALEKKDTDLAAKYFVVEKQGEYLKTLNNWKSIGKLDDISGALLKSDVSTENSPGKAIVTISKEGEVVISVEFIKNIFSEKWKIESL